MNYSKYSGSDKIEEWIAFNWTWGRFQKVKKYNCVKIRCSLKQYGSKIISKIYQSNPRKFHHTIQNIIGKNLTKVEARDNDGKPLQPNEIHEFFASICKIHPRLSILPPSDSISNIPIPEISWVVKKLKALHPRNSSYPVRYQLNWLLSVLIFIYSFNGNS